MVVKIPFSVAKETFLIKRIILFKKLYFQQIWSSGKFFVFLATKLRQACHNFIVHVRTNILRRSNFVWEKCTIYSSFPEFEQIIFGRVVKCFLHLHRNNLRKVIFLSKNSSFFSWFSESELQICGFLEKHFASVAKLHSPLLENRFWWKKKSDQKFITSFFFELGKVFRVFVDNVTEGLSKFLCTCSDEDFEEKWFFGKFFNFSSFPEFQQKFSKVWRDFFGRVVTTKLYIYIGTFWGNKFFFQKIRPFCRRFWNLSGKSVFFRRNFFGVVVKIAFSFAKETLLVKKSSFVQKIVTSTFLEFGKVFRILSNKVTAGLT